jgi:hypothetical protein
MLLLQGKHVSLYDLSGQVELDNGMDWATAQHQEVEFFRNTAPWSNEVLLQSRFGVHSLSQELSEQLVALTRACLPEMRETLKNAISEVERELAALPKALG